jgi:hypothetical protein
MTEAKVRRALGALRQAEIDCSRQIITALEHPAPKGGLVADFLQYG